MQPTEQQLQNVLTALAERMPRAEFQAFMDTSPTYSQCRAKLQDLKDEQVKHMRHNPGCQPIKTGTLWNPHGS